MRKMNKETIDVYAAYSCQLHFNVKDVDKEQVVDWWIRHGTMYLKLKDDSVIEIDGDDTGTDYKWPVAEYEYGADFLELEVHE
jgi:hypothetical protein